jgi:hypothetical protein
MYPGAVHDVRRYADGLLRLRAGNPDLFIFAAITGIPVDLSSPTGDNFGPILADPRMREVVDPTSMTPRLMPSCNVPGTGTAFPPRRIVELARLINERESNGVIQSICQDSYAPALNLIIEKIADALRGACLPRPLNRNAAGSVDCDVVQILPTSGDTTRCDQLGEAKGVVSTPIRMENGHEVCQMIQLEVDDAARASGNAPPGEGWYYDDYTMDMMESCDVDERQRISITPGSAPVTGTEVRLECLQPTGTVVGDGAIGIGTACSAAPTLCDGVRLSCDMGDGATNTCQQTCSTNADCPASFVCDVNRLEGVGPICQNPTCG